MNKKNKSDVLRFIELYRSQEVLWNVNLSSYRRNDFKMRAYESIAAEMDMTVEDVKKKIKSLRTAYSAEKYKVEKSIKSGYDIDSVHIPTLFWYNEMTFLNAFMIRRKTADDFEQEEDINPLIETPLDYEVNELQYSESSCTEPEEIALPTCSKKRRHSPEPKSKLSDVLDKLIAIKKGNSVFETFGENVARQINDFPEEEAYQLMADIQLMMSKRKMDLIRKNRDAKSKLKKERTLSRDTG